MQSQEWLESRKIDIDAMCPDVVELKDALVAIEMAKLEAIISISSKEVAAHFDKQLSELKLKHNIPL